MASIKSLLTDLQYLAMEEPSPITTDDECEKVNMPMEEVKNLAAPELNDRNADFEESRDTVDVMEAPKGTFEQLRQLMQKTAEKTAKVPEDPIFHAFDTAKRASIFETFIEQLPSVQGRKIFCTGDRCPACREFLNR